MRLSVVVPAYNVVDAISDTLESLALLDPPAHEVILVEDGSNDGTAELVAAFIASRPIPEFRLFEQPNQGVSVARNVGLAHATGDYVLFLDGDDTVSPDLVRTLLEANDDSSPADVVCWRFRHMQREAIGQPLEIWQEIPSWSTGLETLHRVLIEKDHLVWTGSAAYRVDFLREKSLQFTPGCASAQDVEFIWKALAMAASVRFVDSTLSTYVWRAASVTNSISARRFDGVLAYHRAASFLGAQRGDAFPPLASAAWDRVIPRFVDYLTIFARTHRGSAQRVLSDIEERNPGIIQTVRDLIRQRQREGLEVPRRWALLRFSPHLMVVHVRRGITRPPRHSES